LVILSQISPKLEFWGGFGQVIKIGMRGLLTQHSQYLPSSEWLALSLPPYSPPRQSPRMKEYRRIMFLWLCLCYVSSMQDTSYPSLETWLTLLDYGQLPCLGRCELDWNWWHTGTWTNPGVLRVKVICYSWRYGPNCLGPGQSSKRLHGTILRRYKTNRLASN
jgi:hypothetical protein